MPGPCLATRDNLDANTYIEHLSSPERNGRIKRLVDNKTEYCLIR